MAGTGLCFPYVLQFARTVVREARELGLRPTGVVIVHGWVRHPSGPLQGQDYEHAWVETNGEWVHDWQTRVRDKGKPIPLAHFYRTYRPDHIKRYTPEQALSLCRKEGHAGPWGKPWYAVGNRSRTRTMSHGRRPARR